MIVIQRKHVEDHTAELYVLLLFVFHSFADKQLANEEIRSRAKRANAEYRTLSQQRIEDVDFCHLRVVGSAAF